MVNCADVICDCPLMDQNKMNHSHLNSSIKILTNHIKVLEKLDNEKECANKDPTLLILGRLSRSGPRFRLRWY